MAGPKGPALPTRSRPALPHSFEIGSGCVDQRFLALERARDARDFGFRLSVVLLLDRLAHTGHRLDGVAGVVAGRVEQMAIPGAPRQTGGIGELTLALNQPQVDGSG